MALPRIHIIVGTRPEAVKMAPLASALRATGRVDPVMVATGQHTTMVTQALAAFDQRPDVRLELDRRTGKQVELVAELAPALDRILTDGSAGVVVQGDTTSALVGGLVAFWRRIPLIHLEAGLRSGDLTSPFPEEANRRLIGVVADLHLAPTQRAVDALLREHVDRRRVLLVGNTVVDAVLAAADASTAFTDPLLARIEGLVAGGAQLMLVTAHRRESWALGWTACWPRSSRSSTSTPTCSAYCPRTRTRRYGPRSTGRWPPIPGSPSPTRCPTRPSAGCCPARPSF